MFTPCTGFQPSGSPPIENGASAGSPVVSTAWCFVQPSSGGPSATARFCDARSSHGEYHSRQRPLGSVSTWCTKFWMYFFSPSFGSGARTTPCFFQAPGGQGMGMAGAVFVVGVADIVAPHKLKFETV